MIVHLLHEGRTLCGFGLGKFPGEWPDGHKWTWLHDAENVTCSKCLEVFKNYESNNRCSACQRGPK